MAGRHTQRPQRGAALLVFLVLLVMGALTYIVGKLTPEAAEAGRARKTEEVLAQARDALIGYAMQYREQQRVTDKPQFDAMYGHLPLPDLGESVNLNAAFGYPCKTEGCAKMNATGLPPGNTFLVGRFPWKTLGIGPLRDGRGECLWYAVSASHRSINSIATAMNWDTLASPDIPIGSGLPDLGTMKVQDRPIAVIFSADAAFDSGRTPSSDAAECGGNYDPTHYLDPNKNNAQTALAVTSGKLFGTLRRAAIRQPGDPADRPPSLADDINDMLDQMVTCARDQIAGGMISANAKINDACSLALNHFGPPGYYQHYRDQVFIARCPACEVNVDGALVPGCAGALLFANQRGPGQKRWVESGTDHRLDPANYLENHKTGVPQEGNLASYTSGGNRYRGPSLLGPIKADKNNPADIARCAPGGSDWRLASDCQTIDQDIVRCIPAGPSQTIVSQNLSSLFPGVTSLATYRPAQQRLTLGASGAELSSSNAHAGKLFACAWQAEPHARGNGLRSYFRFKILDTGDGFAFAIIDDQRNRGIYNRCGAARQHLGYSGNNGYTQPLEPPKIAIEFDTSRNANFDEAGNSLTNGRNDPDYTPPYDNDAHVAIMYWGYDAPSAAAGVTKTGQDDNVHGFPLVADISSRPAPRNAAAVIPHPFPAPYPPLAIAPLDRMRSSKTLKRDFHVRIEVTPLTRSSEDEALKRRTWKVEVWIVPTFAQAITGLSWNGGTITVTAPDHGLGNGDIALIRDVAESSNHADINGDYVIHSVDSKTFKFDYARDPGDLVLSGQPVVMKLTEQVARMRMLTQSMASLSPIVKYNSCASDADCASSLSCAGVEADGQRYCYSGHRPTLFDQQAIYDIDLGDGNYHDALGSIRLGFTIGIGSSDQVVDISEFHTVWLP